MTIEPYNYNDEPSGRSETLVQALEKCERLEKRYGRAKWWLVEISKSKRYLLYLVESLNSVDYVIVDNTNHTFVCATQTLEDADIKLTALDVEI